MTIEGRTLASSSTQPAPHRKTLKKVGHELSAWQQAQDRRWERKA